MAPPAIGTGTLRRLGELETDGRPVLSVYSSLDLARSPSTAFRARRLEALIAGAERQVAEADVDRVRQMLHPMPELPYGARSLAVFSSAEGSAFEAVPLPSPVEPMAVVDTAPWLEPMAAMFTPGNRGVAVVARNIARLFRGGQRTLVEFATLRNEPPCVRAPAEWSSLSSRRPLEEHLDEHARRLSGLLLRAHRRRAFDDLVVAAPRELWPFIEGALDSVLRARLAGLVELGLEHEPVQEIVRAVAPIVRQARRTRAEQALGFADGPAA
jgi:hypothetical protein